MKIERFSQIEKFTDGYIDMFSNFIAEERRQNFKVQHANVRALTRKTKQKNIERAKAVANKSAEIAMNRAMPKSDREKMLEIVRKFGEIDILELDCKVGECYADFLQFCITNKNGIFISRQEVIDDIANRWNLYRECLKAAERIYIGDEITRIPDGVFKMYREIKSVKGGRNVEYLGQNAFFGCEKLADVERPLMRRAQDRTFMGCGLGNNMCRLGEYREIRKQAERLADVLYGGRGAAEDARQHAIENDFATALIVERKVPRNPDTEAMGIKIFKPDNENAELMRAPVNMFAQVRNMPLPRRDAIVLQTNNRVPGRLM